MEKERDLSGFDKNVMELFDLCKDILKAKERRSLKGVERGNPFLNRLEKYIKTNLPHLPLERDKSIVISQ